MLSSPAHPASAPSLLSFLPACSFRRMGTPSESRLFVFDGDLVDRGAWGLEVVLLLAAWKAAEPRRVFLVSETRLNLGEGCCADGQVCSKG